MWLLFRHSYQTGFFFQRKGGIRDFTEYMATILLFLRTSPTQTKLLDLSFPIMLSQIASVLQPIIHTAQTYMT